jgi:hypothetical protein
MATTLHGVAGRLGAWYGHGLDRRILVGVALAIALAFAGAFGVAQLRFARPAAPRPIPVPEIIESPQQPMVTVPPAVEQTTTPERPYVIRFDKPIIVRGRVPRH